MKHQFDIDIIHEPIPEGQTLLYYDGPHMWYLKDKNGSLWYVSWVDGNATDIHGDPCSLFIVADITEDTLAALRAGKLPIRDVLTVKASQIVLVAYADDGVSTYFPLDQSSLNEDWLSNEGVCF